MPDLRNPAERLQHQLRSIQAVGGKSDLTVRQAACEVWALELVAAEDFAEFSRRLAALAQLASEVRKRASSIEPMGPAALEHFDQIESWVQQVVMHNGRKCSQVFPNIADTGWWSLSLLSTLLVDSPPRLDVPDDVLAALVERCRGLIDELAEAQDLPARERRRLIDLVREVEQALLRAQIEGVDAVENAVDGLLGGLVRLYVASAEAFSHPAVQGVGALMTAIMVAWGFAADTLALSGPIGDLLGHQLEPPAQDQ